jgi:putative intracellular protease/amidase
MKRKDFIKQVSLASLGLAGLTSLKLHAHDSHEGNKDVTLGTDSLINVACAISEGTTDIDWVGPEAVFQTWHFDKVTRKYSKKFNIYTVARSLDPVGNKIPHYTFESAPTPQIVVVPAQSGSQELLDWLVKIQGITDITMSVCLGAKHLAEAGLLDGKSATTHYKSIDQYIKAYPKVNWIKNVRFAQAEAIYTGGGLTAGIDLALHIVEKYFNRETAQQVADHLEYQGKGWIQ